MFHLKAIKELVKVYSPRYQLSIMSNLLQVLLILLYKYHILEMIGALRYFLCFHALISINRGLRRQRSVCFKYDNVCIMWDVHFISSSPGYGGLVV